MLSWPEWRKNTRAPRSSNHQKKPPEGMLRSAPDTSLREVAQFFTDLKRILGPRALRRVVRQLLENNGLALAGQLAYLFILFLFPFLIFLVTLVGIVVDDPET